MLWVILGDPARAGRRWTEKEFFATGDVEWRRVAAVLARLGATPNPLGSFVDFGCGVGRVTRQLSRAFHSGIGIDVSERMVATARLLNPDSEFVVNRAPDLRFIPDASVDFVYSHIVLQHLPPSLQAAFMREFLRILAPDGIAAFQVATEVQNTRATTWRRVAARLPRRLKDALKRAAGRPVASTAIELEMHLLPNETVGTIVEECGGTIMGSPHTNSADQNHNGAVRFFDRETALQRLQTERGASPILSRFYFVRRR